ncbi:MAG TPA: STAS domain-containing protein [Candidatus Elarobacter sp.]|nr:STAS domain-containing protein [Candidatus Elarobacter sp.]
MGITNNAPAFDVVRDPSRMVGRVMLSGEIDIYASAELERAFESLSGPDIVIDVRNVRVVSSTFFSALVHLRWRLPDSRIEVVGANEHVRKTFRAVGADVFVTLTAQ